MNKMMLFTDGSVHPQHKIGCGAYLLVHENELSSDAHEKKIKVKQFENTSSTQLELSTLLWALKNIQATGSKVIIYTDSQNIVGLPARRESLEQNDYLSSKNKLLKNHELYREFYRFSDLLDFELIKVKGHHKSSNKDDIEKIFTLVDRASRKALRKLIDEL